MNSGETERTHQAAIFDSICVACLIAYFLHFALPALRGGFREDEMMNMMIYWQAGVLKSLLANLKGTSPFLETCRTTIYGSHGSLGQTHICQFARGRLQSLEIIRGRFE